MTAILVAALGTLLLGYLYAQSKKQRGAQKLADQLLEQAQEKAKHIQEAAKLEAKEIRFNLEQR